MPRRSTAIPATNKPAARPATARRKAPRRATRTDPAPRVAQRTHAAIFAALGDDTRLNLLSALAGGQRLSIARLAEPRAITRQAVTKHLRVLERASLVRGTKSGRERVFEIQPDTLRLAQERIALIADQWDHALARLKASLESPHDPTKPPAPGTTHP